MDRCRWRKQIGMIDDHNECEWYRLTRVVPDKFHRAIKRLCVCVCVCVYFHCLAKFRHAAIFMYIIVQ